MPLTEYPITGDLLDALGGPAALGTVTLTPFGSHEARVDGDNVRLGFIRYDFTELPDPLPVTAGAWTVQIDTTGQINGRRLFQPITRHLTIDGPLTWGEIVDGAVTDVPLTPSLVQQAADARAAAELAETNAEAAAASVNRGQPNGTAPLDAGSKVPDANLPTRLSDLALTATYARLALAPDPVYQAAALNKVMATPPTVTEGAAATITAQIINPLTDTRIRNLHGVTVASADGTAAQARLPRKTDGTFSNASGDYWYSIEFMVDCAAIEFRILGNTNNYVMTVDGERHTATNGTLAGGAASRYLKFDFGGRKAGGNARRVQFTCTAAQMKEIRLAATDTLYPVPRPAPVMAFLGDSYATGYATRAMVSVYDGYAQQLARLLGVIPVTQNSASSTGFVDDDGAVAAAYTARVADVVALNPSIVLVQGSLNDNGASDAALQAAAASVYAALTAALPGAVRIATGILDARASGVRPANVNSQNAALQAAAAANGFTFVSAGTSGQWVSGTGYLTAPTGVGNSDVYTYSDQIHPTTGGGIYLATRLASEIRAVVPALR